MPDCDKMPADAPVMKAPEPKTSLSCSDAPAWSAVVLVALALADVWWHGFTFSLSDAAMLLAGLSIGVGLMFAVGPKALTGERPNPTLLNLGPPVPAISTSPPTTATAAQQTALPGLPTELEKALAEIAVLAWKIDKRAQKEANPSKAIIRNASQIIELLAQQKVEFVSYEGRRVLLGSKVNVMEAIEGVEEDKVIAEHEPEVQVNGRLARKALLSVGKGLKVTPPSEPLSS